MMGPKTLDNHAFRFEIINVKATILDNCIVTDSYLQGTCRRLRVMLGRPQAAIMRKDNVVLSVLNHRGFRQDFNIGLWCKERLKYAFDRLLEERKQLGSALASGRAFGFVRAIAERGNGDHVPFLADPHFAVHLRLVEGTNPTGA